MRYQILVLVMISLCSWTVLSCTKATRTPRVAEDRVPHIKIMSYNVNFGLAGDPPTIRAIDHADCDVVFLQETTPAWEKALRRALGSRYSHIEFRHSQAAGGLGILSKFPFEAGETISPPEGGWFPGWPVVLETPLGRVQVLNVHLRPQISDSGSVVSGYFTTDGIREKQIERYFDRLADDLPTLIVGDFNESGSGDALEFLAGMGLQSALNEFHPAEPTWRWNTSVGRVSSQLDHMVYDRRLEPLHVWVIKAGRSDHLPVVGKFVLAADSR
jgi:endonuclease/exonuclease/phosphatase family metal-dependent hydrolase